MNLNLKGIFTPNNINLPQWRNKKGENEFENMLNKLTELGKKITNFKKKADTEEEKPSGETEGFNPETQTKEETVPFAQYYDSTPRPLGEVFHNRNVMSDRAIYKAREIIGSEIGKLNLPASDIYLIRTDISRYAGDGTPATGRISFQIPFMTPQGDQRTIYADVDIVLSGLMPPKYFTDGLNTKYAFSSEGLTEFLRGRDFEIISNPKVAPETVFFESPGHLAGRGEVGITTYGVKKTAQEPPKPIPIPTPTPITEVMPGTDLGRIMDELQSTTDKINEIKENMKAEEKKLEKAIEQLPEKIEVRKSENKIRELRNSEKELITKTKILLEQVSDATAKYHKDIWKLMERVDIARTPSYKGVIGKLIQIFEKDVPMIKQKAIEMWDEVRSMTTTKELVKQPPEGEPEKWEVEKKVVPPEEEKLFEPTKEKKGLQNGMQKKASISDYFSDILSALSEMDSVLEKTKSVLGTR